MIQSKSKYLIPKYVQPNLHTYEYSMLKGRKLKTKFPTGVFIFLKFLYYRATERNSFANLAYLKSRHEFSSLIRQRFRVVCQQNETLPKLFGEIESKLKKRREIKSWNRASVWETTRRKYLEKISETIWIWEAQRKR